MKTPTDRKYSETHEWFLAEGNIVTIGITQYAADELTDITYVDLPEVGRVVAAGDSVGEVESVKATSEIFSAVPGKIVEVNTALSEHPELINDDAFEEGWILKIKVDSPTALNSLMDAAEYKAFVRSAG
jgi:glycine cleavage system H protein